MKVLVVAYDCIPNAGSEPGLGWQWTQLAARDHTVWALTKASNRKAIEANPASEGINWVYIDVEESLGPFETGTSWGDAVHMMRWLRRAYDEAKQIHDLHLLDLVHHVSFGAFWLPSPMVRLGPPYVFGPVTGGEVIPSEFRHMLTSKARASNAAREALQWSAMRSTNWQRMARAKRAVRIAGTEQTRARMIEAGASYVHLYRPSFSLDDEQIATLEALPGPDLEGPINFVSSGRLIGWKGHILAVEAFAKTLSSIPDAHFHLIGEGSERAAIEARIAELGIGHAITLHGSLHRDDERALIARSHVFVFPSLRDSGATLFVFAMAMGVPIIGFDTGAAKQMIASSSGILVEPGEREQASTRLANAMISLADDPARRGEMAADGRLRVREVFHLGEAATALDSWYKRATESP
ncbi:MAG: glycosyltransferase family 4 protein, partial [Acidimicrobiales bacterium]